MTDFHDQYSKDQRAVEQAEQNPTAFVNFVVSGDTEGLTDQEVAYLDAVRAAYAEAAETAYKVVKAELEDGAE